MMLTSSEYRSNDEELYDKIQKLYDEYFKPDIPYTHGGFRYPMVHVLILRTKSVFARSFCSDFTQPETDTIYHELLPFSVI